MSDDKPRTTDTDAGADDAEDDVMSDPSKGSQEGADWSDEGGATSEGPAPAT